MSAGSASWSSAIAPAAPPVPRAWQWAAGLLAALLALGAVALRYAESEVIALEPTEEATLVSLGGAPQRLDPPPPEVETSEEAQTVAERADNAPPPAAPKEPRVIAGSSDTEGRASSGTGAGPVGLPPAPPRAAPPPPPPPRSPPPGPTRVSQRFVEISVRAYSRLIVYPTVSLDREEQGQGILRATIARDGTVLKWRLIQSTGHARLDAEIERVAGVVRKLSPLPDNFVRNTADVDVPITFTIEYFDEE